MFNLQYKNTDWQLLFLCGCGISAGLAGWHGGYLLSLAAAAINFYITFVNRGYLMSFQVQVHMTYLVFLVIAYPQPMNSLYWLPAIGTWIYLLFDYCLLARLLSLLPYNSNAPFSVEHLKNTMLARPVKNILTVA